MNTLRATRHVAAARCYATLRAVARYSRRCVESRYYASPPAPFFFAAISPSRFSPMPCCFCRYDCCCCRRLCRYYDKRFIDCRYDATLRATLRYAAMLMPLMMLMLPPPICRFYTPRLILLPCFLFRLVAATLPLSISIAAAMPRQALLLRHYAAAAAAITLRCCCHYAPRFFFFFYFAAIAMLMPRHDDIRKSYIAYYYAATALLISLLHAAYHTYTLAAAAMMLVTPLRAITAYAVITVDIVDSYAAYYRLIVEGRYQS